VSPRVGQGYDVHAFGEGDHIVLGGVRIPHDRGVVAHSDGDVVIHAVCDALLGAAALGDLGSYFPDDSEVWRDADSRVLLREVREKISRAGWHVGNVDITVIAQGPRLAPHTSAMRANLAADLKVALPCVSVKATTTERLGFAGRREGIAALAVTLVTGNDA